MKLMLTMTSAVALAALTGFAKEDYSDPNAFAEKYFREAIEERHPVETYMKPMRFKDVKLLNVKRELVGTLGRVMEKVTCDFEPVAESGAKYYTRPIGGDLNNIDFGDRKLPLLDRCDYDIISEEDNTSIILKIQKVRESRPDLVQKIKPHGGHLVAYRAKNDKGVFEPVKMGAHLVRFEGGMPDPIYVFTEDRLADMHVLVIGTKEADEAIAACRAKCEEISRLVPELNDLRKRLGEFTRTRRNEIRKVKEEFSNREYERKNKLRRLQSLKQRQEASLAKIRKSEQSPAAQRGRQRRGQKTVDAASVETRIRELGAEIDSINDQSVKDKGEIDARVAFLEKLIAYERGEADKVESVDGITDEEKALLSKSAIATEIQPKLQRLKTLLGE